MAVAIRASFDEAAFAAAWAAAQSLSLDQAIAEALVIEGQHMLPRGTISPVQQEGAS